MKIQVLGSGCPSCKSLHELTQQAIVEMGLKEKVEYITGQEGVGLIVEMGVTSSPVLAINGKPVLIGLVEDVEKIKSLIEKANA